MNRFVRRTAFTVSLLVLAVASLLVARPASATELRWKTVQLKWSSGSVSKSFTASITDTAFLTLPPDIAWDAPLVSSSYPIGRLDFVTTTAAANADTVHYSVTGGAGGVQPFIDTRDLTPAAGNCAVKISNGLVFSGFLLTNGSTATAGLHATQSQAIRLKVQGDPNGALAGLQAFFTYPSWATK